ncbi:MAG: L-2-amino-thiazoline-4-carboxylic acid hydrolase [Anaerolineae bacterium]|nr:L-2-amino-thiazoline-4-carboxylic acid hydrolase [Anaerolineae bacterium]
MDYLRLILKPVLGRVASKVWLGRQVMTDAGLIALDRRAVDDILAHAWRLDARLAPRLPTAASLGNRHILRLAAMSLAFLQALLGRGVERSAAIALVSQAVWAVFRPLTDLAWLGARLRTRELLEQVRIMMHLSLRYPFCPPGFVFEVTPDPEAVIVDFFRCPVAEYLGAHQAADLCVGAWCQQDFRLAAHWGVALERVGTRATGAERCDFRFVARQ